MISTAVIIFREVLEAALIITLVLAATRGVAKRQWWISGGVAGGLALAMVVAMFAESISEMMEGVGQEVFNASVLFAAVAMLGWHNVWMKQHAKELIAQMKKLSSDVKEGERPLYMLATVVGLAVLREGSEVVLFMTGLIAGGTEVWSMFLGGLIGLAGGVALGVILYFGLARIPTRQLFSVSGWLILLLAASLSSQAAAFLVQADLLPSFGDMLWDSSAILSQTSLLGGVLHTLIGYEARPMGIQLVFYFSTLLLIGGLMLWVDRDQPIKTPAKTLAIVAGIIIAAGSVTPERVYATDFIYSPTVDQGEWEIELKGKLLSDKDPLVDGEQVYKPSVGYGVTSYWFTEIYGEWEKPAVGESEYEATSWENIFQLTQQGEYWVDVGLYAEFEKAAESYNSDKIELKLLLEKTTGNFVHTANCVIERHFGAGASSEIEHGLALRSKWLWRQYFEPAVEVYAEFGAIDESTPLNELSQRAGPVVFGSIPAGDKSKFGYEVGYLFGITDEAADGTFKFMLEYEFVY